MSIASPPAPVTEAPPTPTLRGRLSLAAGLVLLALGSAVLGLDAYYRLFGKFSPYDDEGYILLTVKQFLDGRPLYDWISSRYGPFFFLFNGAVFRPGFLAPTHDGVRLLTLGFWLACSGAAAVLAWRLTGSVLLAVVVQAMAFLNQAPLTNEPGHPIGLCLLLVALLPFLATFCGAGRGTAAGTIMGAFVGCLLLTKINVGAFALLALALTFTSAVPGPTTRALRIAAGLAVLILPAALMRPHLYQAWAFHYAALVTLSSVPVVLLHWRPPQTHFLQENGFVYARRRAAVAAVAACLFTCIATLALGTSPAGLLDGALLQNARSAAAFALASPTGLPGTGAAAFGLLVYLLYRFLSRRSQRRKAAWVLGCAKAGFGAFVFYVAHHMEPDSIGPDYAKLLNLALPFTWLAAVPAASVVVSNENLFGRMALVSVTVLHALVAYPVSGSQQAPATFLLIPVAAVCLYDVVGEVAGAWRLSARLAWLRWPGVVAGAAAVLFAAWDDVGDQKREYAANPPLGLPGCERLRVAEDWAAAYRWLTYNLDAHADTFITSPGLDSLYLWTGKPPPTGHSGSAWIVLLDDESQQQVVRDLADYPRACAVRHRDLNMQWQSGSALLTRRPLVRHLADDFEAAGTVHGFEFLTRKGRPPPELLYCLRPVELPDDSSPFEREWRMVLPPMAGEAVSRMTLIDRQLINQTFADTRPGGRGGTLQVFLESDNGKQTPADLAARPVALGERRCFRLRATFPRGLPPPGEPACRLFDADGRRFASVPVCP